MGLQVREADEEGDLVIVVQAFPHGGGEGVDIAPFKVGGTGVKSYLKEQPEELPTRLEAGTLNGHGIAGLSAAEYLDKL